MRIQNSNQINCSWNLELEEERDKSTKLEAELARMGEGRDVKAVQDDNDTLPSTPKRKR